ncbi:MAG: hypothetical protein ACLR17_04845 [Enterobacteriaceae bacterium]
MQAIALMQVRIGICFINQVCRTTILLLCNGMDLRDTQQAQALKQLAELGELNLTVERDDKRQNIYFVPGDD